MTITLNGTTGITTPDVTADSGESLTSRVAKSGDTMTGALVVDTNYQDGIRILRNYDVSQGVAGQAIQFGAKLNGTPVYPIELVGVTDTDGSAFQTEIRQDGNLHFRIDSAGRVTMPYQPAFRAYTSTDYTTDGEFYGSPGVWVEQYDRNNNFNSGRFTAPVQGTYFFNVMWDVNGALTGIDLMVNGTDYVSWEPTGIANGWESYQYCTHVYLNVGDYVSLYGNVFSAGASHFHMGSGRWGHFSGHLIG